MRIDFLGNLNFGVFFRFSKDFNNPNLYIIREPKISIVPVVKKIKSGLSIYFIVKNAVTAPTNEPKLNAAWYRGVIILDVFCSIIEI